MLLIRIHQIDLALQLLVQEPLVLEIKLDFLLARIFADVALVEAATDKQAGRRELEGAFERNFGDCRLANAATALVQQTSLDEILIDSFQCVSPYVCGQRLHVSGKRREVSPARQTADAYLSIKQSSLP